MSLAVRVIGRLDIKPNLGVVKGVRFEGLRVVGDPAALAARYEAEGIDELLYVDVTASLYGRNALMPLIRATSEATYTPLTVCGGIRTFQDVRTALRWGADKVGLNTGALAQPALIDECARAFGSQAIVVSIDAKRGQDGWQAYTHGGREPSGRNVVSWAVEAAERGAGELLLTSVDRDGTLSGYDLELVAAVRACLPDVVLSASGGCAGAADVLRVLKAGASAAVVGSWLHRGGSVGELKGRMAAAGHEVRL